MLKNLAIPGGIGPEVALILQGIGEDRLFDCLASILSSSNESLTMHAMDTLPLLLSACNESDHRISRPGILASLRNNLQHAKVPVRRAAALCIVHLLSESPKRLHKEFRDAGIESTLRNMYGNGHTSLSGTPSSSGLQMGKEDDREVREYVSAALRELANPEPAG